MADRPVINLHDVALKPHGHGKNFEALLGASRPLSEVNIWARGWVVVPPGKRGLAVS